MFFYKMGWLVDSVQAKKSWSRQRRKDTIYVLTTVFNVNRKAEQVATSSLSFDTDGSTVICDNSANVHICHDKRMFISAIRRTDKHYVATIGRNRNVASGMGTVMWRWKDDGGKLHDVEVHDVLYFPASPVNILSVTSLASQFDDDDGTGIDTKRHCSRFY